MNACINASDIIFAAYTDFPNSSNILTKAALFRKPALVSDGQFMAEIVSTYSLGEVVSEGDMPSIAKTLRIMLNADYYDKLVARTRWDNHAERASVDRLPSALKQVLEPYYLISRQCSAGKQRSCENMS